jgi:hypothetical protein
MTHIQVAASKGMKAGYNARKQVLARSGLSTAQAALAESFGDYCAKFGPDVTAAQASMRNEPRKSNLVSRLVGVNPFASNPLEDEIEQARQRLAELEAQATKPAPKPKAKARASKPKTATENLWREWAVRKHGIPTTVGTTFTYKGKRRTSTFQVTRVTSEGVYSKRVS